MKTIRQIENERIGRILYKPVGKTPSLAGWMTYAMICFWTSVAVAAFLSIVQI